MVKFSLPLIAFCIATACGKYSEFDGTKLDTSSAALREGLSLAEKNCSSCHATPLPQSMTQPTANFVLSYMGLFLGVDASRTLSHPLEQGQFQMRFAQLKAKKQIPAQPALTKPAWDLIRNYYLVLAKKPAHDTDKGTPAEKIPMSFPFSDQAITLLRVLNHDTIAVGGGVENTLKLFTLAGQLKLTKKFSSPPVWIEQSGNDYFVLTLGDLLGSVNPREQSELWQLGPAGDRKLLSGLPRSSHFELVSGADTGFLISAFGNLGSGRFSLFSAQAGGLREQVISRRDSHVRSKILREKGPLRILSLVAGAREQLLLFTQKAGGFDETVLAEYPPHLGSVWLETADIDGDGVEEILVLSGDNADAGPWGETKEDQGLRIYTLDGTRLSLKKFISLPGSLSLGLIGKDIAVARFYTSNESMADVTVLSHRQNLEFERRDLRLDSRATVLAGFNRIGETHLLVGSGNSPKMEIVNGAIRRRDFTGDLITNIRLR